MKVYKTHSEALKACEKHGYTWKVDEYHQFVTEYTNSYGKTLKTLGNTLKDAVNCLEWKIRDEKILNDMKKYDVSRKSMKVHEIHDDFTVVVI